MKIDLVARGRGACAGRRSSLITVSSLALASALIPAGAYAQCSSSNAPPPAANATLNVSGSQPPSAADASGIPGCGGAQGGVDRSGEPGFIGQQAGTAQADLTDAEISEGSAFAAVLAAAGGRRGGATDKLRAVRRSLSARPADLRQHARLKPSRRL